MKAKLQTTKMISTNTYYEEWNIEGEIIKKIVIAPTYRSYLLSLGDFKDELLKEE